MSDRSVFRSGSHANALCCNKCDCTRLSNTSFALSNQSAFQLKHKSLLLSHGPLFDRLSQTLRQISARGGKAWMRIQAPLPPNTSSCVHMEESNVAGYFCTLLNELHGIYITTPLPYSATLIHISGLKGPTPVQFALLHSYNSARAYREQATGPWLRPET